MRIAFLAADDPIYLPAFFDRVLAVRASETVAVYLTPPLYRRQTRLAAAWRYYRTFGLSATVQLAVRILQAQRRRCSATGQ